MGNLAALKNRAENAEELLLKERAKALRYARALELIWMSRDTDDPAELRHIAEHALMAQADSEGRID